MNQRTNAPVPPTPLSEADVTAWLDYALETLLTRRDEIIAALRADAAAYPVIQSDDVFGDVSENVRLANALNSVANERRLETKRPFLVGGKTVDGWFERLLSPLEAALLPMKERMTAYGLSKTDTARRAAQDDADRQQAEAERLAARAADVLARGADATDLLTAAERAATAADRARALAEGKAAALSRVRGSYGAVASLRTTWGYEVTDIDAVPRTFLKIEEATVKAAMKAKDAQGRPVAVIPGIVWRATQAMGVR